MVRLLIAVAAGLVLVPVTIGLVLTLASEAGEVVVVTPATPDADSTRLWVVEHGGNLWLRAGNEGVSWYDPVTTATAVIVERDGVPGHYQAIPDPGAQGAINRRMADRYGLSETIIALLTGGRDAAIPIRLHPRPAPSDGQPDAS